MHGFLWFCIITASLGGLVFGYHTAIIAGAMLFIKNEFQLTSTIEGVAVSILLLGALAGASFAGPMADRYGRRSVFYFSSIILIAGTIVAALAKASTLLLIGRFFAGISVGLYSVVAPMYLGEIASKEQRGTSVAFYQFVLSIGILIAYSIVEIFAPKENWRAMFAWGTVPGILQLLCLPFLAESPVWLMNKGRDEKAKKEAKRLKMTSIPSSPDGKSGWKALFTPGVKLALIVGLGISCIQQLSGINAVFYYAPELFELIGLHSEKAALVATIGIGLINLAATWFSVWLLDKIGRRILLVIGLAGIAISLAILAFTVFTPNLGLNLLAAIAVMSYVAFFGVSLGPVTWVVIAEIYPLNVRGKAMSIAILSNWLFNYLVSFSFLIFVGWIGTGGTFTMYLVLNLLALIFVVRYLPETKGKSSEEITSLFKNARRR